MRAGGNRDDVDLCCVKGSLGRAEGAARGEKRRKTALWQIDK